MKLYEIANDIQALLDLADADGTMDADVEEQLDSLDMAFERKVENCVKAIRNYEAEHAAFMHEMERLARHAQAAKGRVLRLKNYVKGQLERLGKHKIRLGVFSVWIQRNSIASVYFAGNPAVLPKEFTRIKIEINNEAVRDAYKEGKPLPEGVRVETGTSLRIG